MKIRRVWSMPNKRTFKIKPIEELIRRYVKDGKEWVDPYANEAKWGTITNDLNEDYDTDYHMDAFKFLQMLEDNQYDGVLYDPPYSNRQRQEMYNGVGIMEEYDLERERDELARIVKHGGYVISFGWTTIAMGEQRGFHIEEVLIVPHGGNHYDTVVVVEKKGRL